MPTTTKKNGWLQRLTTIAGGTVIVVTIPLLLTVRGQDERYQDRVDTMQDSLITVALNNDDTLAERLTTIEHFHIRKEQFDEVQAKNTTKILELLGARPWEIESYPDAEDERGSDAENTVHPFGPVVPASAVDSAGISGGSG